MFFWVPSIAIGYRSGKRCRSTAVVQTVRGDANGVLYTSTFSQWGESFSSKGALKLFNIEISIQLHKNSACLEITKMTTDRKVDFLTECPTIMKIYRNESEDQPNN